jgi:hypothetical protein
MTDYCFYAHPMVRGGSVGILKIICGENFYPMDGYSSLITVITYNLEGELIDLVHIKYTGGSQYFHLRVPNWNNLFHERIVSLSILFSITSNDFMSFC